MVPESDRSGVADCHVKVSEFLVELTDVHDPGMSGNKNNSKSSHSSQ